jgi:phosphoribosylamine--glycine ligase
LEVSGGRVLAVAALGESVLTAQQTVYQDLADIAFEGMYFRRDIGYRAIAREVT